ncbi:hypothetical protein A2397_01975 [Candidatus Amesbacteria bacterium RIFOXYB1_FULL_44_23]|uniref:TIGR00300 family protein n=1 Tax=Candidatus Amesbacteria bacterium RIFOXYB1_FULL_44_23 TaxID=1797263 RepID=A0A1F4ZUA6_9BACT|nr:MAG: hypothetical protein A2397_01975 [Candidatus Amesbacteria bacterium RIFOXYB1_FULL_44_23]
MFTNAKLIQKNWRNTLKQGQVSLVVVREGEVLYANKVSGVSGLVDCFKQDLLSGSEVYDTKIGLAAAKLLVWGKARSVFALTASQSAVNFCKANNLAVESVKQVDRLYFSNDLGGCLFEKTAFGAQRAEDLIRGLEGLGEVRVERCTKDGVFPLNYYSTSNRKTWVNLQGKWTAVRHPEMDKAIRVGRKKARTVATCEVKRGDMVVVGDGLGVYEEKVELKKGQDFGFMSSEVSAERPKEALIGRVAEIMRESRREGKRTLLVGGPAIVHTGSGKYLSGLIRSGWIDVLFGGNAIAAHDLEENYLGTSLGTEVTSGNRIEGGHHHHLRTINTIRFYGGIKNAVVAKVIKSGIFYECVRSGTKFVLAGSIRDDGPLTDVITDSVRAQMEMRKETRNGFGVALMVATTLHSVATGNLLSFDTTKIIVDDNLASVTKLADRGTNALGIVTDCAYFLSQLCNKLEVEI